MSSQGHTAALSRTVSMADRLKRHVVWRIIIIIGDSGHATGVRVIFISALHMKSSDVSMRTRKDKSANPATNKINAIARTIEGLMVII